MDEHIALFCMLYPTTVEKKQKVLSLLDKAKPYYQSVEAKCTTWTYFTPSQHFKQFGVPSNLVAEADKETVLAGMEIYTEKSALSTQLKSPMFKSFQEAVEKEQLYSKNEEMIAWYPVGGFVSRGEIAAPFGHGIRVLTGWLVSRSGQRDRLIEILSKFADWMKDNEPGFLTYSIMTRPKAPDEVLIFERCTDADAFQAHTSSAEFKKAMDAARPYMKSGRGQEWTELDNAFVGNKIGGREEASTAKL